MQLSKVLITAFMFLSIADAVVLKSNVKKEVSSVARQLLDQLLKEVRGPLVAFSASNPANRYPKTGETIAFSTVQLNLGNAYDSKTGQFTAPVYGLYEFNIHICNGRGKYIVSSIIRNEEEVAVSTQWDDTDSCGSVNALVTVNAGEKVYVKCLLCAVGSVFYENVHRRNTFTGVLLH